MRHFFLACVSVCLLCFTAAAQTQPVNSTNLLTQFLDLPAPPPPDRYAQAVKIRSVQRPPEFYEANRVPADDAPIEDLLEYWAMRSGSPGSSQPRRVARPSERVLERILDFCEENPEYMAIFLGIVPTDQKSGEIVKRIYDKLLEIETANYNSQMIKNWLTYNSAFFVEELVEKAEKVKDKERYVINHRELLALARVDWERAAPILERLAGDASQPVSQTLAYWAYYARAIKTENEQDVTKYRRLLQDAVTNRELSPGNRDLAMDALVMEKEWEGRDEWYLSMLEDESLFTLDRFTGLTTILRFSEPEKMIPAMTSLIDSKNPAVRKAAVRNLVNYARENRVEAVRALLPWLSNPAWMSDIPDGRNALITALGKVDLPESVPVLITILMNEENFRTLAAEALARYKDPRAVPALKVALAAEKNAYRRITFIRALDECGGISDDEKILALEAYAEAISTPEGQMQFSVAFYGQAVDTDGKPQSLLPIAQSIGNFVSQQTEPSDGLAARAIERLKTLRKTKPAIAQKLSDIMHKWRGRVMFIERLRQIKEGEATLETILTALAQRREIREKAENEIFAMRGGTGLGRGIAACLAEDDADLQSVLRQRDATAQIAMLGCARLLRGALPVGEVGALLKSPNKTLALAAERYLESQDSVEARTLILAQRPGEAVILGARPAFIPDMKKIFMNESLIQIFQSVMGRGVYGLSYPLMDKNEALLREEVKTNPDLLAIYAIFDNSLTGQMIIRVFKDKVVFTHNEDAARYRERVLTAKEYEDFYRLIINEKIDLATPAVDYCESCTTNEFVMFGKNGGRRVFFHYNNRVDSPMKKLFERFASFNEGNLKLRYRLADRIQGLEVLLADPKFPARAVWKNGADLRVVVEDKDKQAEIERNLQQQFEIEDKQAETEDENYERYQQVLESQEKRQSESKYLHYSWRGIENGALGVIMPQPLEMPYLYDETQVPEINGFDNEPRGWQLRAGGFEIRVSHNQSGLYKVARGQAPVLFKEGNYDLPIVTPDGKWVVASKVEDNWQEPKNLVRINLQTGKEFPVNLPPADAFNPLVFLPAHNKVLVYRAKGNRYYGYRTEESEDEESEEPARPSLLIAGRNSNNNNPSPQTPEFYLLDAATGAVQPVKGEFRPLQELTYRPLQATNAPDEFWAAVYDKKTKETAVGRYNTKTFAFQTLVKLPEIKLSSMDIWVDEKEAKVYFVYEGHVLTAPLIAK
jgi:hypothetical protein